MCRPRASGRPAPLWAVDKSAPPRTLSPEGKPRPKRTISAADSDQIPSPTRAILLKQALPRESPCPPIATLFATALLDPTEDSSLGLRNEDLFELMEGSFVFVGGNFRGAGDLMTTPLHTLLPGVYYHAVALDNLFAFDGHPKVRKEFRSPRFGYYVFDLLVLWLLAGIYLRRQHWVSGGPASAVAPFSLSSAALARIADVVGRLPTPAWVIGGAATLLLLAAFPALQQVSVAAAVVLLVAIEIRISTARALRERLRSLLLYLAALALSLLVVALAMWLGYHWLSLPPVDWVGYLSFAAFGFFVANTAILEFARRVDVIHGTHRSQRSVR